MKIVFSKQAWEDYLYWQATEHKRLKRVNDLIKEIARTPYEGTGKPEALRHALAGFWSRRIDDEHRLVYKVESDCVYIVQARYHY